MCLHQNCGRAHFWRAAKVLRDRAGSVKIRQGKGGKERELPLNTSARRGLSAYLDTRQPLRPDEPLITSETGAAISVRSIQSVIAELARRARITRIPVNGRVNYRKCQEHVDIH